MDPQTMREDFERALSVAHALASVGVAGAVGLSLLMIGISIVTLFASLAVLSLIRAALPDNPAEGPVPWPGDILYASVAFGMAFGGVECLCGALVYLYLLISGEVAWSTRALSVLGVELAIAGLTFWACSRMANRLPTGT